MRMKLIFLLSIIYLPVSAHSKDSTWDQTKESATEAWKLAKKTSDSSWKTLKEKSSIVWERTLEKIGKWADEANRRTDEILIQKPKKSVPEETETVPVKPLILKSLGVFNQQA
ncbi:hypothetical protein [Candidatus Enterovibrio escicola]|uniref:hypothetical protein n=1 Tax=Candidatus Enterovibrio escicola TaxID=1927127 RepID=UPI001237EB4B|nr:hypothetical protein [Candidatus Enterovibrio escacola]